MMQCRWPTSFSPQHRDGHDSPTARSAGRDRAARAIIRGQRSAPVRHACAGVVGGGHHDAAGSSVAGKRAGASQCDRVPAAEASRARDPVSGVGIRFARKYPKECGRGESSSHNRKITGNLNLNRCRITDENLRRRGANCHTGSRSATLRHGQVGEKVGEGKGRKGVRPRPFLGLGGAGWRHDPIDDGQPPVTSSTSQRQTTRAARCSRQRQVRAAPPSVRRHPARTDRGFGTGL